MSTGRRRGGLHLGNPTAITAGTTTGNAPEPDAPEPDTSGDAMPPITDDAAPATTPNPRAVPEPPAPAAPSLLPALDGWATTHQPTDALDDGERERWRAYLTRSAQGLAAALRTTNTRATTWAQHCTEARTAGIPEHLIHRVATDTGVPIPPRT